MRWWLIPLVALLTACGEPTPKLDYSAEGEKARGDMLVGASLGEASNLIPFVASDSASQAVAGLLYSALLKYDKDLNLVGELASSWRVSADGLQITFTLREGLTWQDGQPLTAHDVYATWRAVTAPTTLTPYAGDYLLVKKAEVLGPRVFRVTYDKPFAPALASWASLAILPKHKLEATATLQDNPLKDTPLANGPYTLERWRRGQEIVLRANPQYHEGEPWITRQRTRLITDQDAQFLELRAGRLDTTSLTPAQFTRLTDKPKFTERFNKYAYLSNSYVYLGFNLQNPLFADRRVRQALSYATPREAIIRGVMLGQGEPITGPFKPGTWAYNNKLRPYAYSPDCARTLFKEAGWTDSDGDGWLDKNGQPFRFTVVTNQGNDQRIKTAEIMQYAFRQVGLDMTIRVQEWATLVENTINARAFEAILLGWSMGIEPDPYDIFHSSKTGPREFNFISFNHPEADRLMTLARETFDQSKRKKYLDDFQEILHQEQPYLFLFAPQAMVALHKRFKGVEPAPAGIGYNMVTDWYVPVAQQLYPQESLQP